MCNDAPAATSAALPSSNFGLDTKTKESVDEETLSDSASNASTTVESSELDHALAYLEKIKIRFSNDPRVYKKFLDIMKTFKMDTSVSGEDVFRQVSALFRDHHDLIDGFVHFMS